jgi:glycosyltransferase involved in cell wall biosynthesis
MVGGQAHAARDIHRGFASDGEVEVTVQAIDPRLAGPFRILTDVKVLRTLTRPLLYLRQLLGSARRADVLHVLGAAHTAFLFGAVPAILVGRLLRRRIILNYHDGRAHEHFRYWGAFLRSMLRRVDRIVVPSRYLQKEFRSHGFEAEVIPNVIDTTAFSYQDRSPIPHRLVSTRLLEPLYALEVTLLAFRRLQLDYPDLVLEIYGDGAAGTKLRDLTRRLSLAGVTFHGEVPHARIPEALAQGGIMVNSSRVDNMPHFVLEAYASGLPIVSTAAGGIPYMIDPDRTGLLVPPDDPDEMAAALRRVLDDPELAWRLSVEGHRETPRYTWVRVKEQWRHIYQSVAGRATRQEAQ